MAKAAPGLNFAWWLMLFLRAVLPAGFALATGRLVSAIESGTPLNSSLILLGLILLVLLLLGPLQAAVSGNLGDSLAAWLYDKMTAAVNKPAGLGHLEDAALASDLALAREIDLGISEPPLAVSLRFIAAGLADLLAGLFAVITLARYNFWGALLLAGAWTSTHWLLRESSVWKDRNTAEVRAAQREAGYLYNLAVQAPAAKEIRLFGLANWLVQRFLERRVRLFELRYTATRLRQKPLALAMLLISAVNLLVFWSLAQASQNGSLPLDQAVVAVQMAAAAGLIAFGGLNWAFDGAAAPVAAVLRLEEDMEPAGRIKSGTANPASMPARSIRFKDLSFSYPSSPSPVLQGLNLEIPAGTSLAIVGVNGAGKTTLAKLLCRLYEPQAGSIEVDGVDLRTMDLDAWRGRISAIFQDYLRLDMSLRENVAPTGADDACVLKALELAGADKLRDLDTILSKAFAGGSELSGGQWQRVALARAICGVLRGAGLLILDEPTAQLDVRGEAEIFKRVLEASQGITTILISHRFSTVRQAQRICVLDEGKVIELGSHAELMALGGHYAEMFTLQAKRFADGLELEEGVSYESLA